jgi:hypothetical protein
MDYKGWKSTDLIHESFDLNFPREQTNGYPFMSGFMEANAFNFA